MSAAIAVAVGAEPDLLHRLLRCLVALGVLIEQADGQFANTELGQLLRSDVPESTRSTALGRTDDAWWAAWAELPRSITSGRTPFEVAHGQSFWDRSRDDRPASAGFNAFMAAKTARFVAQLVAQLDFSTVHHVIDIGGGSGTLLAGIRHASAHTRGSILDCRAVSTERCNTWRRENAGDRIELITGSFFDAVPSGGDVYVLRQILHGWPDDRAADILSTCRQAMGPQARLLVIDQVLPERASDNPRNRVAFEFDLHMFVMFGARERTERELRELLASAGFTVDRVLSTTPESTIVAIPA